LAFGLVFGILFYFYNQFFGLVARRTSPHEEGGDVTAWVCLVVLGVVFRVATGRVRVEVFDPNP
jgi:hypothetical protein